MNSQEKNDIISVSQSSSDKKRDTTASNSGGIWIALTMFGFLVLIIAVEMLRSKG